MPRSSTAALKGPFKSFTATSGTYSLKVSFQSGTPAYFIAVEA